MVFDHITLDGYFAAPNGDISFLRQRIPAGGERRDSHNGCQDVGS
jgi:hypothetical protein